MEDRKPKESGKEQKFKSIYEQEHEFIPRKSYFDNDFEDSILNTKEFKGFVNLFVLLLVLYLMTTPIYNFIINGTPIQTGLIERMVRDFKILIFVWPVFHFWTYFSFFLQVHKKWHSLLGFCSIPTLHSDSNLCNYDSYLLKRKYVCYT